MLSICINNYEKLNHSGRDRYRLSAGTHVVSGNITATGWNVLRCGGTSNLNVYESHARACQLLLLSNNIQLRVIHFGCLEAEQCLDASTCTWIQSDMKVKRLPCFLKNVPFNNDSKNIGIYQDLLSLEATVAIPSSTSLERSITDLRGDQVSQVDFLTFNIM